MNFDPLHMSDGTYINIVGLIQQAYLVVWVTGDPPDDSDDERIVVDVRKPQIPTNTFHTTGYIANSNDNRLLRPLSCLLFLVLASQDRFHFERQGDTILYHPDIENEEFPWTSEVGTLIHTHFVDRLREFLPQGHSYLASDWDDPTERIWQSEEMEES